MLAGERAVLCTRIHLVSLSRFFTITTHTHGSSKFMGTELAGKTLAVVGCGRIGQQVAKWGQAFDMKVIGFDPVLPAAAFKELGIKKTDLDKIWPQVRGWAPCVDLALKADWGPGWRWAMCVYD